MFCSVSTPISLLWWAVSSREWLTPRGGPRQCAVVGVLQTVVQMLEQEHFPGFKSAHFDLPPRQVVPRPIQRPHPLLNALLHVEGFQRAKHALIGVLALETPERRKITEVLLDGEIEVERRLLEHHAERPERLCAPFRRRAAGDLDASGGGIE